jgi:hypothetical protein
MLGQAVWGKMNVREQQDRPMVLHELEEWLKGIRRTLWTARRTLSFIQ